MHAQYLDPMATPARRRASAPPSSRLTRAYQATIPAEVRRVLRLEQDDVVQFRRKHFTLDAHSILRPIRKWSRRDRTASERSLRAALV
jgi:bifunctional DNA-binding transcriptional regulator/antitoxin component of YhaV-PrlF toxin-antitoxin module